MTTQMPSVGRIVHYFPSPSESLTPLAALVVAVSEDGMPSMLIFRPDGSTIFRRNVPKFGVEFVAFNKSYWNWPARAEETPEPKAELLLSPSALLTRIKSARAAKQSIEQYADDIITNLEKQARMASTGNRLAEMLLEPTIDNEYPSEDLIADILTYLRGGEK